MRDAPGGPAKPKVVKKRKPAPKPKPSPVNAQYYVSQGKAVQHAAKQQKAARPKPDTERARRQRVSVVKRSAPSPGRTLALKENHARIGQTRTKRVAARHPEFARKLAMKNLAGALSTTVAHTTKVKNPPRVKESGVGGALADAAAKGVPKVLAQLAPGADSLARAVAKGRYKKIAGNFGRELVDLPANAVPSTYALAKKATKDPKGAAKDLIQPYKDLAKNPVKFSGDHPLSTYLMVKGGPAALDRGAGKAVRTVTGKAATREVRTVPGTRLVEHRRPQKGFVAGKVQRRLDARRPKVMTHSAIKRRVNETFAADEDVRRIERSNTVEKAHRALTNTERPTGGPVKRVKTIARNRRNRTKPTAATVTIAQNITRASKEDVRAELTRLEHVGRDLKGAERKANRSSQKQLRKALKKHDAGGQEVAARRYAEEVSTPLQKQLHESGLFEKGQVEKARLIPYATRHMGARVDKEKGLVSKEGNPISTADIRAHMKANHVSEPAFVSQAPNQRGAKNFYVPTHKPPTVSRTPRTGAATEKGTADLHPDVLVETAARAQGLVTAAKRYPKFMQEFGHRSSKTGKLRAFTSRKAADKAAADVSASSKTEFVPVRLAPFMHTKHQLDTLLERANDVHHPAFKSMRDDIEAALEGKGERGPWVLIPRAARDQALEHVNSIGTAPGGRLGNMYGSTFRKTVLATSPKWLTGNVVEAAMRTMVGHAGPRSYFTGRAALKRLEKIDPEAAMEAKVRTVPGGHYSLMRRNNVHTEAEHFAGTKLAGVAQAFGKLRRTPGPKQAVDLWHAYTDFVFNTLNGRIESQFQTAMLGKALRDSPLMDGHVVKLSSRALDDAAKGLRNTNAQVALGREVDRMFGSYGKFSPTTRKMIATYTPFVAWTINATKFVLDVLPRDHPVASALLASANIATEEWRKDHGLVKFMDGAVPGWLQGSIPGKGGSHLRASRYTPFGAWGDLPATWAGTVLPQADSIIANMKGKDWTGKDLPNNDNEYSNSLQAAVTFLEGVVPGAAQIDRAGIRGEGTVKQRLRGQFDPFMYTKGKQGSASASIPGLKLPSGPKLKTAGPKLKLPASRKLK